MSKNKTAVLQTVIEELDGDLCGGKTRRMVEKPNAKSSIQPSSKNGKIRHTKRVVVKLPTVNRRANENKVHVCLKGTESMKGTLEEIQEESIETKEDCDNVVNGDTETNRDCAEQPIETYIQTPVAKRELETEMTSEPSNENAHNPLNDQIYGMFSRMNTEPSIVSDNIILSNNKKGMKQYTKIPKSGAGWSKKDLDMFLPRKSFFNVHDNTMSEAGFDIRKDEERKRPDWRRLIRMHTMDELYPPEKDKEVKPVIVFGIGDDESEEEGFGFENVETAISVEGKDMTIGTKTRKRLSMKRVVNNEKEEYKPLYDYLKYVHDNPEEYIHTTNYSGKNTDHKHPNNLVRLGRVFRRGHHGAVKSNIFLHAITGLKPKLTEPSSQRLTRAEKAAAKKDATDGVEPMTTTQDETEIEKLKSKAEKWMRTLTTQQLLKAKELALKDVGEEDINMSKWWLAFRSCHYLRLPSYIADST